MARVQGGVVDLAASRKIELEMPDRIITSRVAYKDRNRKKPNLPVDPKARLVVHGQTDPDLIDNEGRPLRRDAPTVSRIGLMLVLQVLVSLFDGHFFTLDATSAFLQGDRLEREEKLYLRPPRREGFPGCGEGQLLELLCLVFGLADAPRAWWKNFVRCLLRLGFKQLVLDVAIFVFYHAGQVVFIIGIHVDDIFGSRPKCPAGRRVLQSLLDAYQWGDRKDNCADYNGRVIARQPDGTISVSQEQFALQLKPSPLTRERSLQPDDDLTAREVTEFKSGNGCLQWLSLTRADLAAATSLGQVPSPKVKHLMAVNALLKTAKASASFAIVVRKIDFASAIWIGEGDASFATAADHRSQLGALAFFCEPSALTPLGGRFSLLWFQSTRIKRACRSTIASETMAMGATADTLFFMRHGLRGVERGLPAKRRVASTVVAAAAPRDGLPVALRPPRPRGQLHVVGGEAGGHRHLGHRGHRHLAGRRGGPPRLRALGDDLGHDRRPFDEGHPGARAPRNPGPRTTPDHKPPAREAERSP